MRFVASLAALVILAVVPAAEGMAASNAESVISMYSDPGDWIGDGVSRMFHADNATFTVSGDAEYLTVRASGGTRGEEFSFDIAAPPGQRLAPGLYPDVQRAPFRESGHAGLDIHGEGRGCNKVAGRFDVKDIVVGSDGTVQRLWLTYEQHCEGGVAALFGEVRLGTSAGDGASGTVPELLWFPDVHPGTAGTVVPVWLVSGGTSSETVNGVSVEGLHAADFPIRSDECSGRTLDPGGACVVYLRFAPSVAGPRTGSLRIDTSGGVHTVMLDGIGIPGRTRWHMDSDEGDYIGHGEQYRYDPSNAQISARGTERVVSFGLSGSDGSWWYADFAASDGDILVPGTYDDAHRYPFHGTGPGMAVTGNGRGCNDLTGTFTVTHADFTPAGEMEAFGVTFEQHCEGADPALRGTIEYRVPTGDVSPPAAVSDLQVSYSGSEATVTWQNPADADHAATFVRYIPGARAPTWPSSGVRAYAGPGESTQMTGLAARRYTVAVFPVDAAGNVGPRSTVVVEGGSTGESTGQTDPSSEPTGQTDPSSEPTASDTVTRLWGSDRIETAVEISRHRFPDGAAGGVVLARADDYPDALAGAPLAAARDAPVLLTPSDGLDDDVSSELSRVLPPGRTVVLLGGEQALAPAVEHAVADLGYDTERIAGEDRFATATAVAQALGHPDSVLIAVGTDYPDALAAGAAAAHFGAAVLLTTPDHPEATTSAYLEQHSSDRFAVGGPAARAYPGAVPVVGATREDTAVAVAVRFFRNGPAGAAIARRDGFADALAGGVHAGAVGAPVLLTTTGELHPGVSDYLCDRAAIVSDAYLYGGSAALSIDVEDAVADRIAGRGC